MKTKDKTDLADKRGTDHSGTRGLPEYSISANMDRKLHGHGTIFFRSLSFFGSVERVDAFRSFSLSGAPTSVLSVEYVPYVLHLARQNSLVNVGDDNRL